MHWTEQTHRLTSVQVQIWYYSRFSKFSLKTLTGGREGWKKTQEDTLDR